jgi:hypothetical protein
LELNNDSFNELIEKNKYNINKKLLIIFYANNCEVCTEALNVINNNILDEYKYNSDIDFGRINCDLKENIWLNIRFNIKRIPYIIIINGNYYHELKSYYGKYELKSFINDKKDKNELIMLPDDISLIQKGIYIANHLINYYKNYFKSNFNLNINSNIIIFIFILFIFLLLWLLKCALVFCCCGLCLGKICKRKKGIKKIVEINEDNIKDTEEKLSNISSNLSENEIGSNEGDNNLDVSGISDSLFKENNEVTIKKNYKKEKND